jgi:prevent-host-death family protein
MRTVSIQDAEKNLSQLVEQAALGDAFVIAVAGKPLVKVTPLASKKTVTRNRLGFMTGQISIPDDFDQMGRTMIASLFEGDV